MPEYYDTKSLYWNRAVRGKAWNKIQIYTASTFCTDRLPTVGGRYVLVLHDNSRARMVI